MYKNKKCIYNTQIKKFTKEKITKNASVITINFLTYYVCQLRNIIDFFVF